MLGNEDMFFLDISLFQYMLHLYHSVFIEYVGYCIYCKSCFCGLHFCIHSKVHIHVYSMSVCIYFNFLMNAFLHYVFQVSNMMSSK